MNKKMKTTDFEMNLNTGSAIYVTVDNLKFTVDEELPSLKIEVEDHGEFQLIEERDFSAGESILNHKDLKRVALNWILNNVEIVSDFKPKLSKRVDEIEQKITSEEK